MPIGINHIESVNVYLVEDGDSVTLVDCGMWHPGEPDDGLTKLRDALNARGYVLDDISRIIVTHAHIDHYGMAGRLMELTGAELFMHAMTDLDCEKYRHPETAQARKRDTYSDHGVPKAELPGFADTFVAWMPYLHSVVEASTRLQWRRGPLHRHTPVGSPAHTRSLTRSYLPVVAYRQTPLLRRSPPTRGHSPGHIRARIRQGSSPQLSRISQTGRRARSGAGDAGTRPRIRRRPTPRRRDHTQQTTPPRRDPRHDPQPSLHRP